LEGGSEHDNAWLGTAVTDLYPGEETKAKLLLGGVGAAFAGVVLHDDAEREFAYTSGAEKALQRAAASGWTVVSMKIDSATVLA
jgi:hypothetical protein